MDSGYSVLFLNLSVILERATQMPVQRKYLCPYPGCSVPYFTVIYVNRLGDHLYTKRVPKYYIYYHQKSAFTVIYVNRLGDHLYTKRVSKYYIYYHQKSVFNFFFFFLMIAMCFQVPLSAPSKGYSIKNLKSMSFVLCDAGDFFL